jgi:hypothetical protein
MTSAQTQLNMSGCMKVQEHQHSEHNTPIPHRMLLTVRYGPCRPRQAIAVVSIPSFRVLACLHILNVFHLAHFQSPSSSFALSSALSQGEYSLVLAIPASVPSRSNCHASLLSRPQQLYVKIIRSTTPFNMLFLTGTSRPNALKAAIRY